MRACHVRIFYLFAERHPRKRILRELGGGGGDGGARSKDLSIWTGAGLGDWVWSGQVRSGQFRLGLVGPSIHGWNVSTTASLTRRKEVGKGACHVGGGGRRGLESIMIDSLIHFYPGKSPCLCLLRGGREVCAGVLEFPNVPGGNQKGV